MKKTKRNNIIILFLIGFLIFLYVFLGDFYREKTISNPVYRVCTLTKIEFIGKNSSDWLYFKYTVNKNKKQGKVYIKDSEYEYYKKRLGKSYIIAMNKSQIVNKLFLTYHLYVDYPVPNSYESPPNGWNKIPIKNKAL
jgi:hypothetical protein